MRYPRGVPTYGNGGCCPKEWNRTPDLTGSFELDAVIRHCANKDMVLRLATHLVRGNAYGVHTGYNGYSGNTYTEI